LRLAAANGRRQATAAKLRPGARRPGSPARLSQVRERSHGCHGRRGLGLQPLSRRPGFGRRSGDGKRLSDTIGSGLTTAAATASATAAGITADPLAERRGWSNVGGLGRRGDASDGGERNAVDPLAGRRGNWFTELGRRVDPRDGRERDDLP